MNHATDSHNLTNTIRQTALDNGADLVGFAPTDVFELNAPTNKKPSLLMPNPKSIIVIACGRKLNEDRLYTYEWDPGFSRTTIRLKKHVDILRKEARKSVETG